MQKVSVLNKNPELKSPGRNIRIQPKLQVGAVDNPLEKEADSVADQVLRMPDPGLVRRKCTQCDKEEKLHRKSISDSISPYIMRNGEGDVAIDSKTESAIKNSRGGGTPFSGAARSWMESRFGTDFSKVNIHTGSDAVGMSRNLNAEAFTLGKDIYFNEGKYNPDTSTGKRLLAHELTHVIQNTSRNKINLIQRYESPEHKDIGDQFTLDLRNFLETENGKKWARINHINNFEDLKAQMKNDPFLNGEGGFTKIKVGKNLNLTTGEIIALMGDFYGSWKELQNANPQEISGLLSAISTEKGGTLKNPDKRYNKITQGRYLKLAQSNLSHFTSLEADKGNRSKWLNMHTEAIRLAKSKEPGSLEEALGMAAATNHFLTDAFAAGHIFDAGKVLLNIKSALKGLDYFTLPTSKSPQQIQSFTGSNPRGNAGRYSFSPPKLTPPSLAANLDLAERQITAPDLSSGTSSLNFVLPKVTSLLVLKLIHDRMNREGFEVRNNKGMKWKSFGDKFIRISDAQDARMIAAYAVFLSRQQIYQASAGKNPNPEEVLDLLPDKDSIIAATNQATKYIKEEINNAFGLVKKNADLLNSTTALSLDLPLTDYNYDEWSGNIGLHELSLAPYLAIQKRETVLKLSLEPRLLRMIFYKTKFEEALNLEIGVHLNDQVHLTTSYNPLSNTMDIQLMLGNSLFGPKYPLKDLSKRVNLNVLEDNVRKIMEPQGWYFGTRFIGKPGEHDYSIEASLYYKW